MKKAQKNLYDVIVVGAGHAGVEAALAAHCLGQKVLVITSNVSRIAFMSCNPSIGGLGKGHIVKEIDVLGGFMPLAADEATIQFKRLNQSKGPAVRGSRVQCDKDKYSQFIKEKLFSCVEVIEAEVKSLLMKNSNECEGVILEDGSSIASRAVILTTGTFMGAVMHFGHNQISGGREGDKASLGLSDNLRSLGFEVTRLKTGTPPRLDKASIDWTQLEANYGDDNFFSMSCRHILLNPKLPQVPCYQTYTNEQTHDIIRSNLHLSALHSGRIESKGPRYCPSVEDKIIRFADKDRHLTFLEPETLAGNSIYLQGLSTCLPEKIQEKFLKTLPGLKNVKILKPGYAVEYDFMNPHQIQSSLETKGVERLYFAGQINGSSGYEEAACQGLMAGINASFKNLNRPPFFLGRDEAYIGVLIDDLVVKGTKEPYRMLTSRAEHRLILREDNVLSRLLSISYKNGLLNERDYELMSFKLDSQNTLVSDLKKQIIKPNDRTQKELQELGSAPLRKPLSLNDLLKRGEMNLDKIFTLKKKLNWCHPLDMRESHPSVLGDVNEEKKKKWVEDCIFEPVHIQVKYEGYINRNAVFLRQAQKVDKILIPQNIDLNQVHGLSLEDKEKIATVKPLNLGQVQRISGVNPSAIQSLLIYIKLKRKEAFVPRGTPFCEKHEIR